MGNYILDMFIDYAKKNWVWCLLITAVLLVLKMTLMPYLSFATVTVCIWGAFLVIPIIALSTYSKSRPIHERFSEKLRLNRIEPTLVKLDNGHAVSYMKNNMKITVAFTDCVATYVMKKLITDDEKRKTLNDNTPSDIGYYQKKGTAIQKHVFISKSVNDVYNTMLKDIRCAERAFEKVV